MFLKRITLVLLLMVAFLSKAEIPQLTNQSKVIMFTCDPGSELYAGFGHSAIWISDNTLGIDRLYNYGTFDFNTPNFYWKFIKGQLDYMVTVTTARRFINEYSHRKAGVVGQTLNLTWQEKQKLFNILEVNLLPENRFYKYDFYYDNCATRIRDIIVKSVNGDVNFNTADQHISFRQILLPYLEVKPWTKFGINLILGLSSDKIASPNEYMYIPEYMKDAFKSASINKDDQTKNLVKKETKYLDTKFEVKSYPFLEPLIIFSAILFLILLVTFYELRTRHYLFITDVVLNTIAVIAGLFLLFMWIGTDLTATNYNLNILWLLPAQAVFLSSFFIESRKKVKLIRISFSILIIVFISMLFWSQETEISFFIIILIYALRYLFYTRLNSNKIDS